MPETKPERLVIFVNGSGPNTYDNRRQINGQNFNYFDLFAEQITADGNAFFRWNTRGCTPGDEPPLFTDISEPDYQTYVPENSIADVEAVISGLRDDERLSDCPVILLGWSEGTMIAPQVAARGNVPVDALVPVSYTHLWFAAKASGRPILLRPLRLLTRWSTRRASISPMSLCYPP